MHFLSFHVDVRTKETMFIIISKAYFTYTFQPCSIDIIKNKRYCVPHNCVQTSQGCYM